MKKVVSILLISVLLINTGYSQLRVSSNGSVLINANINDWGSGLKVVVPTANSCAYHLSYLNKDRFYVCAQGWLWSEKGGYFGSDLKYKKNVSKINSPLYKVLKLNGIQFDYIDENNSLKSTSVSQTGHRLGFIAQEVEQIIPGIVQTMPDSTKAVAYTDLIALLVEAIKEQQVIIDNLQFEILELTEKVSLISSQATNIQNSFERTPKGPSLKQNRPNPFNQSTEINYFLPEDVQTANIYIYDLNGTQLKNIPIKNKGEGSVLINGAELKAGMYHYVLVVNGQIVDSRKMILIN